MQLLAADLVPLTYFAAPAVLVWESVAPASTWKAGT
jgi:hypothetical protein